MMIEPYLGFLHNLRPASNCQFSFWSKHKAGIHAVDDEGVSHIDLYGRNIAHSFIHGILPLHKPTRGLVSKMNNFVSRTC